MNKNSKSNGPGRPKYEIKWPRGKFTFTDLEIENGVNPKTGKGKNCTTLTLRKGLRRDQAKRNQSMIVCLKDILAEPNSKKGMGRKQLVYAPRSIADKCATQPSVPRKAKTSTPRKAKTDVTVNVSNTPPTPANAVSQSTLDYEAKKAALLAPTPAVTITSDPSPAPVAEPLTEMVNAVTV
jgi:hypothetical protein